MTNGLFIFHRDFRIVDNSGLIQLSKKCDKLYTCFVFTNEQVSRNSYKSTNAIQFMIESLVDLEKELSKNGGKLIVCHGPTVTCLSNIILSLNIDIVGFNEDYTPYAKERIDKIQKLCKKNHVECEMFHDYYINEPGTILSGSNTVYQKFTPYYEKSIIEGDFKNPSKVNLRNLSNTTKTIEKTLTLENAMKKFVNKENDNLVVHGGRDLGLTQLKQALVRTKDYKDDRDDMSKETSILSAYIKFGCVSIREVTSKFSIRYGKHGEFIRQLIWRDFYMDLLNAYPESLGKLHDSSMDKHWTKNENWLNKWKKGETGFPLVDAGMRQMNQTGYMHNRARMIVASFLTKILNIDWREGEKYFAQTLVDYDPASNSGNWQAVVGGGLYSMPWFRVLSPWAQSEKNDVDSKYVKTWIPELKDVLPKHIHKWYKYHKKNDTTYPRPMIDYDEHVESYMNKMKNR